MADRKNEESKEDTNSNENNETSGTSATDERAEYFEKLEKWLQQAYAWQSVAAMFPYYVMSSQVLNPVPGVSPFPPQFLTISNTARPVVGTTDQQNDLQRQRRAEEPAAQFQPMGAEGLEYRIPPIWKRLAAEFIDSLILLILRISISLVIVNLFNLTEIENSELIQGIYKMIYGYKMNIVLMVEVINSITVCTFEAFWLQRGINGRIGGTTPGKLLMGLRVVLCRNVVSADRPDDPDVVFVSPGTDLGLPLALARSVIKYIILSSLFPICFGIFFFKFNRTGYDLVCNSIVVEDRYRNINNNRFHGQ